MNPYQLIYDYREHDLYRESFCELAREIFRIDFRKWYEKDCWDDRYICYSYVDQDRVIANVSVNKMTVVYEGKEYTAIQIGTVMTHPDYRGQGLSASLMKKIDAMYEGQYDFMYLFANDSVLDFYPKFGFTRVPERRYMLNVADWKRRGEASIRQLHPENSEDWAFMKKFAAERVPVSPIMSVKNSQHVLMFHFLASPPGSIIFIEEEDTIVLFTETERRLHLFDVISRKHVDLEKIVTMIMSSSTRNIIFHFVPDYEHKNLKETEKGGDELFVRPTLPFGTKSLQFPLTSHA